MEQIITDRGLVGWRGYAYARPHYLTCMGTVMMPYEANESFCPHGADHISPDENCSCGFYAFKSKEELANQGYGSQDVIAEVYLWGKVIECVNGYRAQFCYPKKLYSCNVIKKQYVAYLADTYGVPYDDTTRVLVAGQGPSTATTTRRPRNFTFEELWEIAFSDAMPLDVRRFARQQIRQRTYMKLRNKEQTLANLEAAVIRVGRELRYTKQQMEAIDELKDQLKGR